MINIFLIVSMLGLITASNLRFMEDLNNLNNTTNSNIKDITVTMPLFLMPKCKSDMDCSQNGYCEKGTGECICAEGYQTFISTERLLELKTKYNNSNLNANFTKDSLNWEIINLSLEDLKFCNYEQKKQLTAFLLSLLVGFGTEHFYLGNYKVAAAKVVFYTVCGALNLIYFILYKCVKDGKKYVEFIGTYEALYLSCGFLYILLWNAYDLVHIGFNNYTDGHGFPMLSWNSTSI